MSTNDRIDLAEKIVSALDGAEIRPGCTASARLWTGGSKVRVYVAYRLTSGGASPRPREAGYFEIVIDSDGDVACTSEIRAEERAIDAAIDHLF